MHTNRLIRFHVGMLQCLWTRRDASAHKSSARVRVVLLLVKFNYIRVKILQT